MRFHVRDTRIIDALRIVEDIRPEDRREWEDALGLPIETALPLAVGNPDAISRTVFGADDAEAERPLIVWGAEPIEEGVAQVWLAAACRAIPFAVSLHSVIAAELPRLDAAYPRTIAYADPRNTIHTAWLAWMGWGRIGGYETPGPAGLVYSHYERTAPCVRPS